MSAKGYFYSDLKRERGVASRFLLERMGYPDEGSNFERELGHLKYLFRAKMLNELFLWPLRWYMFREGRDAILLEDGDRIVGHTAFRVKKDSMHVFSVEVDDNYKGSGHGLWMQKKAIRRARKMGLKRIRIGGGNNDYSNQSYMHFCENWKEYGVIPLGENWLGIL